MVEQRLTKPERAKALAILNEEQIKSYYSDINFHEKEFMCLICSSVCYKPK